MQASALSAVHYPDAAPASKTGLLRLLKIRSGEICCDFCIQCTFHLQDLLNLSHMLFLVSSNEDLLYFKSLWVKQLLHSLDFCSCLSLHFNYTPFLLRYEDQNYPLSIVHDFALYSNKMVPFVLFPVTLPMMFNILLVFLAATVHSVNYFVACQWVLQGIFSAG